MNRRRVIQLVLLLLVGGAIVNVAVAWGCALFIDVTAGVEVPPNGLVVTKSDSWELVRIQKFGVTSIDTTRGRGDFSNPLQHGPHPAELAPLWGGVTEFDPRFLAFEIGTQSRVLQQLGVLGCGWPLRSLWCETYRAVGEKRWKDPTGVRGALDIGLEGWRGSRMWPRVLPLRPIWPGFAINTIFYAAILWVLFAVPLALRRRRRMQRGLCSACAYPVGTSSFCTECGRHLNDTSRV